MADLTRELDRACAELERTRDALHETRAECLRLEVEARRAGGVARDQEVAVQLVSVREWGGGSEAWSSEQKAGA